MAMGFGSAIFNFFLVVKVKAMCVLSFQEALGTKYPSTCLSVLTGGDNIKKSRNRTRPAVVTLTHLVDDDVQWRYSVKTVAKLRVPLTTKINHTKHMASNCKME